MEGSPRVSICIPVYNGARYLDRAVKSAIGQEPDGCEVLVVDNASDDETPALLGRLQASHPRLRVYRNPETLTMVENFNTAISRARGEYILLLPHDDELLPGAISALLGTIGSEDHLLVGLRRFLFDGAGLGSRWFYTSQNLFWRADRVFGAGRVSSSSYLEQVVSNPCHNLIGEPGCVLFSARAWRETGGFSSNYHQLCDLQFWHRVASRYGLRVVPQWVAVFRVHRESQSWRYREQGRLDALAECLGLSSLLLLETERPPPVLICNYLLDRARWERGGKPGLDPGKSLVRARGSLEAALHWVVALPIKRAWQLLLWKSMFSLLWRAGGELKVFESERRGR